MQQRDCNASSVDLGGRQRRRIHRQAENRHSGHDCRVSNQRLARQTHRLLPLQAAVHVRTWLDALIGLPGQNKIECEPQSPCEDWLAITVLPGT